MQAGIHPGITSVGMNPDLQNLFRGIKMEQANKTLFVIDNDPIVPWPVIVELPAAGGTFVKYQFTVLMRVLSPLEYEALFADAPDAKGNAPKISEIVKLNTPIFQRLITGWEGVTDRDGNAVTYTPEKLAEQITGPYGPALSAGLWRAISEVRFGKRLTDGTETDGAALGN